MIPLNVMTEAQRTKCDAIARAAEQPMVVLLESGEYAYVQRMLFTYGLLVGCDESGYRTRFCYEDAREAVHALLTWDGRGDPPGRWIKEKKRGGDRENPLRFLRGIPIVVEAQP